MAFLTIGVHARSLASTFILQIRRWPCVASARTCPLVFPLLYPSRTCGVLSVLKTDDRGHVPLISARS
jgi:hypothetical protein